jgi:hypothetical protein
LIFLPRAFPSQVRSSFTLMFMIQALIRSKTQLRRPRRILINVRRIMKLSNHKICA